MSIKIPKSKQWGKAYAVLSVVKIPPLRSSSLSFEFRLSQ